MCTQCNYTSTVDFASDRVQDVLFSVTVQNTHRASRNALPKDFPRIIKLIENGTINTDPWITLHVEFHEVAERFEEVTHPSSGALKAVIHVAD